LRELSFAARPSPGCIPGMAKMEEGVKILLDIDRVLNAEEIKRIISYVPYNEEVKMPF